MVKKVIVRYFMVLMLTAIGFASAVPNGVEIVRAATIIEMEWDMTFGGASDDAPWSIVQTMDGGFAFAGWTTSYGAGRQDFWLVKTDANGQHEWNHTFGGTADDWANSMILTADGGFALAGWTISYGARGEDFWLVKTDANGQPEWNHTYGGIADDTAISMIQTADGGFALIGWTTSYGAGESDFWLVKTNTSGQPEWNHTYGGTAHDGARSMIQTADGGFALLGGTFSYGPGGNDFWLIKTDASGQPEWNRTFGGPADDWPTALVQTADGGFALAGPTGWTSSSGADGYDFWLVKTDANGQAEWNRTFGGTVADVPNVLVQTPDGGFALAGWTTSYGAGGEDFWLVRTDASGQHEWHKTFGGTADDWANSMILTADGGFALAGVTRSYGAGARDAWLIKASESEETTTQSSPSWTLVIVIMSLTALIVRKRMKRFH